MDNCSIHHIEPVMELVEAAGIVAMFLPPYCPDLNPKEEVFSLVRSFSLWNRLIWKLFTTFGKIGNIW